MTILVRYGVLERSSFCAYRKDTVCRFRQVNFNYGGMMETEDILGLQSDGVSPKVPCEPCAINP